MFGFIIKSLPLSDRNIGGHCHLCDVKKIVTSPKYVYVEMERYGDHTRLFCLKNSA